MAAYPRHVGGVALVLALAACAPETEIRTLYPEIALFPEVVDFGDTVVPYTGREQLIVQNAGKATLDVQLELVDDNGVFALPETSGSVAADSTWPVEITFSPPTYLAYEASVIVRSNDPDAAEQEITIQLVGRGVDAPLPDISVTPTTLDFGEIAPGSAWPLFIEIENVGSAPLQLGVVHQEGSGAFQLSTDPSTAVVGARDTLPVILTYAPTSDQGDSGTLLIRSDDPDEPEVTVLLLGNGGGDYEYPVAEIDCPQTSAPPEWKLLDGSGSHDPNGGALTYAWSLVTHPPGSQSRLTQYVTDSTQVWTDLAGEYQVQLAVTNEQGTTSAPARCYLDAIPEDELHIELTWDKTGTDFDLHLLDGDADFFSVPGDCTWCNKNPQWGAAGSSDDPRLDLDDRSDGPENINVLAPADGHYPVRVHYFEGQGAATATVRVWAYGDEIWSGSKVLQRNDVWNVGQVNWPDGTFGVESTPLYSAPRRSCD